MEETVSRERKLVQERKEHTYAQCKEACAG
jgi:hypothetical protein